MNTQHSTPIRKFDLKVRVDQLIDCLYLPVHDHLLVRRESKGQSKVALSKTSITEWNDLSTDVHGETILASASLNALATCAIFSAPQSLPPPPHINVTWPSLMKVLITHTLSNGVQ
jgi:hypothetical protein